MYFLMNFIGSLFVEFMLIWFIMILCCGKIVIRDLAFDNTLIYLEINTKRQYSINFFLK